jgi:MoxR-like ATPase
MADRAAPIESASAADVAAAQRVKDAHVRIKAQLHKTLVGLEDVIDQLLVSIFARGHCLLVGVPGLAKTLLVSTLARSLSLSFNRIQFTPDLMPADITGTEVIQEDRATGTRAFKFLKGPIFANVILADEINRTPPKTQAALLEAMQEHRVTIQGRTYTLDEPFFVFATQNPIELEGTYPLPEAQLDRFMFHIVIDHPPEHEELEVVRATTAIIDPHYNRPVTGADLIAFQRLVRRVPIADPVLKYALSLVRTSRPQSPQAPESVKKWVQYGASVRAAQYLVLGGKSRALTSGRYHVSFDDIRAMAHPVLRHRVLVNFRAESEGITTDSIIDELLQRVPVPASGMK